ncbi:MAG: DUF6454 family protein, partial [Microbacteriaceae bacterium]
MTVTEPAPGVLATALREAMTGWNRQTRWHQVGRMPLKFPTFHPQGMAFIGERIFLSSVEILEAPAPFSRPSVPGRGIGHLFVVDGDGSLIRDIILGEGLLYHPGGIGFDGKQIWVPVGEYRPAGNSMMLTVDPDTFAVAERFRVADSIGWAVSDPETGLVHGGNWGSRRFYAWTADGQER